MHELLCYPNFPCTITWDMPEMQNSDLDFEISSLPPKIQWLLGERSILGSSLNCSEEGRKESRQKVCYIWPGLSNDTHLGNPVAVQKRSTISLELQYLLKTTFQTKQQQWIKERQRREGTVRSHGTVTSFLRVLTGLTEMIILAF